MNRGYALPAVAVAAALVGILAGWSARDLQCQNEQRALLLDRALIRVTMAADSLDCLARGQDDGARRVLEKNLEFAVGDASEMVRLGAVLRRPPENLEEGLQRARAYAARHHMPAIAMRASEVLDAVAHPGRR
jgi:hypothetical protein